MAEARRRAIARFRITDGGGTVIGAEGDTIADLLADLRGRYGERLMSVEEAAVIPNASEARECGASQGPAMNARRTAL